MLRFGGFRVNFKIATGKQSGLENFDEAPGLSLSGAYRLNRDELYDKIDYPSSSRQITPSMVKLPVSQTEAKPFKSVTNLTKPENDVNVTQSTPNIPTNVQEQLPKNQIKEQQKLEKERLERQKKEEKMAAKEKEKSEKLRKEREKQNRKTEKKKKTKRQAPQIQPPTQSDKTIQHMPQPQPQKQPQPRPRPQTTPQQERTEITKPQARTHDTPRPQARKSITLQPETSPQKPQTTQQKPQTTPQKPQTTPQIAIRLDRSEHSTNTLESSISRNSGPPPYTIEDAKRSEHSGNITFKVDESSWDMIHQHRQTINRPQVKGLQKQTHLDLNFNSSFTNNAMDMSDA